MLQPEANAQALDDWLKRFGTPCAMRHQAAADCSQSPSCCRDCGPRARSQRCDSFEGLAALACNQRWLVSS